MNALELRGLVKQFGARRALDGLDLFVPQGVVAGVVGPNGAGKTTAFSVLCGFLQADAGSVRLLGQEGFDPVSLRGRVGVLPQDAELPLPHTPTEVLRHLARLQGLGRGADAAVARALDEVRLDDRAREPIGRLSHGMRRRVAVASALLGTPELIVLDEPTSGLDPVQARSLRAVLAGLRGRATVVVSSHNLLELEMLADWVVMMDRGRTLRQGPVAEVTGAAERAELRLGGPLEPPEADNGARAWVAATVTRDGERVVVTPRPGATLDAALAEVVGAAIASGVPLLGLRRGQSLEDRFVAEAGEG